MKLEIPEYVVDLTPPERERWQAVIAQELESARQVADEAKTLLPFFAPLLAPWLDRGHRAAGGWYRGEMEAWADALGVSMRRMLLLQHLYEISHLRFRILPRALGCTSGVRWFEDLGMVHVRTLDWPLPSIRGATRLFRFRSKARDFVTVGIAGFVGVLSGMVPGGYSATINWAPAERNPRWKSIGPAYLLRRVLETCDRFDDAVSMLAHTPLSTSVIYTVCGAARGQACVIERTQAAHSLRGIEESEALTATNHYLTPAVARGNRACRSDFIADSTARWEEITTALHDLPRAESATRVGAVLDRVENELTCHKMIFIPARGSVVVWAGD